MSVFPVLGKWTWGGGVAEHRKRPLGNWQSDNAVDIMAPAGSAVVAAAGGRVVKVSGSDPRGGVRGTIFGRSVTILDAQGREHFYTHIDNPFVRVGQYVQAGAPISRVAGASGWSAHLHYAVSQGDPQQFLGGSVPAGNIASAPPTATPAGLGCLVVLIAQLSSVAALVYTTVEVVK